MNIYYLKKFRKLAKKKFWLEYFTDRIVFHYHTCDTWANTLGSDECSVCFRKSDYYSPQTYVIRAEHRMKEMMRDEILIRVRQIPKKKRK